MMIATDRLFADFLVDTARQYGSRLPEIVGNLATGLNESRVFCGVRQGKLRPVIFRPVEIAVLDHASKGNTDTPATEAFGYTQSGMNRLRTRVISGMGVAEMSGAVGVGIESGLLTVGSRNPLPVLPAPREIEAFDHVAQGRTRPQAARAMGVSSSTAQIYALRAHDAVGYPGDEPAAIRAAYEAGMLPYQGRQGAHFLEFVPVDLAAKALAEYLP